MRLPALLLAASMLLGCAESTQVAANAADNAQDVAEEVAQVVEDQSDKAELATAKATTPVVLAIREAVEVVSEPLPAPKPTAIDAAAVELVVRWEVGSPKQYTTKYQGVICPGGASGPTIGIGDDLGHQTASEIRKRWGWHPQVERMVSGSGKVGPAACAAWKAQHRDIRIPYTDAIRVFTTHTWPSYLAMASRAYRNGWKDLSKPHQYGLGSNGYNRGFSMSGSRNTEKRHTRDVCVPANDAPCTAVQLRTSCRVWDNQPSIRKGLCARRHAEADFAVRPV